MKINLYSYTKPAQSCKNIPSFQKLKIRNYAQKDVFLRNYTKSFLSKKSLNKIEKVQPQNMAGTKCKGSIPLKNFWDIFKYSKVLKNSGYSTNKDGYGESFLKAKSNNPISTSYVHDCSVMYLFNDITKTHALYHALADCPVEKIWFMIKNLMPEGFTKGAVIPGDSQFYKTHKYNMKNMFNLMQEANPNAVINVYHTTSKLPEIVGFNGEVYQIPNKKVLKQVQKKKLDIEDSGQASFRIVDVQEYNTFDAIIYDCNTIESLNKLKRVFYSTGYPKEILAILTRLVNIKIEMLENKNNVQSNIKFSLPDIIAEALKNIEQIAKNFFKRFKRNMYC